MPGGRESAIRPFLSEALIGIVVDMSIATGALGVTILFSVISDLSRGGMHLQLQEQSLPIVKSVSKHICQGDFC
jgi:hypothetical protein